MSDLIWKVYLQKQLHCNCSEPVYIPSAYGLHTCLLTNLDRARIENKIYYKRSVFVSGISDEEGLHEPVSLWRVLRVRQTQGAGEPKHNLDR